MATKIATTTPVSVPGRLVTVVLSLIVGLVIVLNQCGLLFIELLDLRGVIAEWILVFNYPNEAFAWVGFGHVLIFFIAVSALTAWRLQGSPVLKPFLLGLRDGTLAAPALCIIGSIGFVALYVIWFIIKILISIVAWIATPIVWIYIKIIVPIIHFISPPFVWLFNLIEPILSFILKWILLPIFAILIFLAWGGFALAPFSIVGRAFISDARTAWTGKPDPGEAYGHGIMLGLIFWAAVISMILETRGVLVDQPAAAVLLGLVLGALFVLRFSRPATGSEQIMLRVENLDGSTASLLRGYWLAQSGLAVVINSTLGMGALILRGLGFRGSADDDVIGATGGTSDGVDFDFS